MMSGKLDFRQTKAASEPRKAVLRSASKEPKPEASAQAAPQASGNAGALSDSAQSQVGGLRWPARVRAGTRRESKV